MSKFSEAVKEVQGLMNAQEDELATMMREMGSVPELPSMPPRLLELITILQQDPILIPPILELVKIKQAEIMDAKGVILYGKEKWDLMKEQAIQASSGD